MGQGARTVFAQIVAHELGVPMDRITVVMGDTGVVPYDQQTSASRSTVLMGSAVLQACVEVQAKIRTMAARLEGVGESEIAVESGVVRLPEREIPILQIVKPGLGRLGGEVIGNGESRKEAEPGHPLSGSAAFYEFNCTAVEAEVDEGTGEIILHRYVTVSDVGRAINPLQVRGQDEGAAIQGLGHTLMEHYILDDRGRIQNLGAIDYRIPTSMDLPIEMRSDVVENADGPGPYGAKGMSEGALLPRRSGRGGRGSRRDRSRHSRPAAHAGAGLAGARGTASARDGRPSRVPRRKCDDDSSIRPRARAFSDRADRAPASRANRRGGPPGSSGSHLFAGCASLSRDAALPRPSTLSGPQLPDASRHPGRARSAMGAGERCRPRLHG